MILEDLLMVLSCLALHILWKVQAVPILPLSLVPDTFDDAYVGCSEEMEEKAGLLLKEEMARHALLRESWEAAQEAWAHGRHKLTLPPGFKAQHGVAVMVYTNSSNTLYWELNQAVRTGGRSRELYMRHFPFKALHFYLTRALQLLRGTGGCSREAGEVVFRGVSSLHFEPKRLGDSVRLGQFASSSVDERVARRGEETWLCVLKSRAARVVLHRGFGSAIREDAALGPWGVAALQSWTLKPLRKLGN
ncbi:ecto-ADP-ribosyltransferase 5 isoform X5 [Rattus norvegicus]|uniref:ecto-ADP-ribosyltransferase 5 isoform X5 n=1 Tax=Rattus norvegicus TaxID=10116 RepID=UPI0019177337|nr:ecto-ADP-ribosyltransferase 5 isoform X7 [Rattus norvegicus]